MSKLEKYKATVRAKAREGAVTAGILGAGLLTPAVLGVVDAKAPTIANAGPGLDVGVAMVGGAAAMFGPKRTRNLSVVVAVTAAAGKVRSKTAEMAAEWGQG